MGAGRVNGRWQAPKKFVKKAAMDGSELKDPTQGFSPRTAFRSNAGVQARIPL